MPKKPPPDSPISDATLEEAATHLNKLFRIVRRRAPKEVQRQVRLLLEDIHTLVQADESNIAARVKAAGDIERLIAEFQGRSADAWIFYRDGHLGITRAFDPIKIRGCIDYRRIEAHMVRLQSRAERGQARLAYFFEKCGLAVEEAPELKPWQMPYSNIQEVHEFLWRKR